MALTIDKTWTLFLDRDGVINLHYPNDYVKDWGEFVFLDGVLAALKDLTGLFRRIVIVTNQQGVAKKLMTEASLDNIHEEMRKVIRKEGGNIHGIYAATEIASPANNMRKPNIGMALKAKKDFQDIDLAKSVMVGDSVSDMEFGKNAGMVTVFVGDVATLTDKQKLLIDMYAEGLPDFCAQVIKV
jgi:histidinol-phosphate phosphatase family protein